MSSASTEHSLREWRYGQAQAERLVAQILHLEGFAGVNPQHPLGGPDGKKDILFQKNQELWIAAAYFPTTPKTFGRVKRKFTEDIKGIKKNGACGIAFFVNQQLSIDERASLAANALPQVAEIYHCERIRSILDSPRGCGLRLQYLRIGMTEEEQWSFWQSMNSDLAQGIANSQNQLSRIERKLDEVFIRSTNLLYDATANPSSILRAVPSVTFATSALNLQLLCWIHRMATDEGGVPEAARGRLRAVSVWLAKPGSAHASANSHPPESDRIVGQLDELFKWWTTQYPELQRGSKDKVLVALAKLHHRILCIHPFLDANGRVARLLIDQAAHELLGEAVSKELVADSANYYKALEAADRGDMLLLTERIRAALL